MTAHLAETASSTPLVSLTAVVLDTETTGLDTKTARIIQIGAVRIEKGKLNDRAVFDKFVRPGTAIPAESTKIHGITDQDVAGASTFTVADREFRTWAANSVILGYSIGFDVAMFKSEAGRAGASWSAPRCLDVRHLVQVLAPPLPDLALDTVAAWLGLKIEGRHNALADARATAEVYLRLVPKLRGKGILTLAEAENACRRLTGQISEEVQAGWHELAQAGYTEHQSVAALARIDSFPYRHRIKDIMSSPPVIVAPEMTVRDVLAVMMEKGISSVFVRSKQPESQTGIFTERDVLRTLNANPDGGLAQTLGTIAVRSLSTVTENEHVYRAIGQMDLKRFRHLGVRDEEDNLVGVVTARDLLGQRARDAISMSDEIERAEAPEELGLVWSKLTMVALGLTYEDVDPRNIAAIISNELRALTRQACVIAEKEMAASGQGSPPVPYAMMVLGSGGRGESLLAMDQDNAIIYDQGEPGGDADRWLEALATRVADILNTVGVAYCKGGIMAMNAEWRMSAKAWRNAVSGWIGRSKPEDILNTDIFFDSVPVYGELELGQSLRNDALDTVAGSKNFLHLLTHNAADVNIPIGWFGRWQLEKGRIDLKKGGIMPIFSSARVLALKHGIQVRATPERLEAARPLMPDQAEVIDNLIDAHRILLGAILGQQLRDIDRGISLTNTVAPKELSAVKLESLKWAVEQVRAVPDILGTPPLLA